MNFGIKRIFGILGIASLALLCCHELAVAQTGTVLWAPDSAKIASLKTVTLELRIDQHVSGVHCFILSTEFDTTLLEIVSITEGPLLRNAGSTFFFWDSLDHPTDIGNCILGYGLYANGPGVLAIVTFRARLKGGVSPLAFSVVDFSDIDLHTMTVEHDDGKIVVEAVGVAPAITSTAVTLGTVGQLYQYDVEATGEPFPTYSLITPPVPPAGMAIDPVTGLIQWMPAAPGDFNIVVSASNGIGEDTQTFTIHVGCCIGSTGNVDGSGIVDGGDLTYLIDYLSPPAGPALGCADEGNIDGQGIVDGGDLTFLIDYLSPPTGPSLPPCP